RQLTEPAAAECLFDRGLPAQRLEHTDGSLCFHDPLGNRSNLLLVRPPGKIRHLRRSQAGRELALGVAVRLRFAVRARLTVRGSLGLGACVRTLSHTSK